MTRPTTATVRELMAADPPCCVPADGLQAVADRLAASGDEIAVVADLESRRFLGVVTSLSAEVFLLRGGLAMTALDAMIRPPATVGWDSEVFAAANAMQDHWLRHLVVLDADGAVVGTLTRASLAALIV